MTWATINYGGWVAENQSDPVLESESCTGLLGIPSSSSKQNLSISSSRDKRDDAISFSTTIAWGESCWNGIANSGGFCQIGSITGGRSSRARKSSFDTSILANRGSPALMAYPISWNIFNIGSNSRIRWTTRSYLSLQIGEHTSELQSP